MLTWFAVFVSGGVPGTIVGYGLAPWVPVWLPKRSAICLFSNRRVLLLSKAIVLAQGRVRVRALSLHALVVSRRRHVEPCPRSCRHRRRVRPSLATQRCRRCRRATLWGRGRCADASVAASSASSSRVSGPSPPSLRPSLHEWCLCPATPVSVSVHKPLQVCVRALRARGSGADCGDVVLTVNSLEQLRRFEPQACCAAAAAGVLSAASL
jgi:hypothetical protein